MKGSHLFALSRSKGMTVDIWIWDYNPPRCFQKKISGRSKHSDYVLVTQSLESAYCQLDLHLFQASSEDLSKFWCAKQGIKKSLLMAGPNTTFVDIDYSTYMTTPWEKTHHFNIQLVAFTTPGSCHGNRINQSNLEFVTKRDQLIIDQPWTALSHH
jgi:hypothetical protein